MRGNKLSRRTIVYVILLVAVFLLLASVVSGCTTPESKSDAKDTDETSMRDPDFFFGPDDSYYGPTRPDTGKRIPSYPYGTFCSRAKCPHGRGTLSTDGGILYKGDFRYGVMHGTGDYEDDNIEYVGGFRHGVPHGPGTLRCLNGTKYKLSLIHISEPTRLESKSRMASCCLK
mgnify:CR=1 FL=1